MRHPAALTKGQAMATATLSPSPSPATSHGRSGARILVGLLGAHGVTANLVPDAQLAALAIEHGVAVASADADFARWPQVRWINPVAAPGR